MSTKYIEIDFVFDLRNFCKDAIKAIENIKVMQDLNDIEVSVLVLDMPENVVSDIKHFRNHGLSEGQKTGFSLYRILCISNKLHLDPRKYLVLSE